MYPILSRSMRHSPQTVRKHLKHVVYTFSKGMFLMWPNGTRLPAKRTYSKGMFYMVKISKISSALQVCYFSKKY